MLQGGGKLFAGSSGRHIGRSGFVKGVKPADMAGWESAIRSKSASSSPAPTSSSCVCNGSYYETKLGTGNRQLETD